MDRGAARSRKRAAQPAKVEARDSKDHKPSRLAARNVSDKPTTSEAGPSKPRQPRPVKAPREPQSRDPALYRPKAVRTAAALNWSQEPFTEPPSLTGITRVDLSGSEMTDVSWLKDSEVRWLSLAGCKITKGWEAVGSLKELTVLNISDCGLTTCPKALTDITKVKAVVAMNNPWSVIDDDVVKAWKELNSMIVSHSPNLTKLPSALSQLYHLSKLTFSHCPKLVVTSLPDLSTLPLLRDVKMNNLPLLQSLPSHMRSWGTGSMSLVSSKETTGTARQGQGLEVLDLGNCALPYSALSSQFQLGKSTTGAARWPNLRSLTLHSNPLCSSHENYADLVQSSPDLPNIQIIDAKRVKERKRKGEVSEKSGKKQRPKVKPSGANTTLGGTPKAWGADRELVKSATQKPSAPSKSTAQPSEQRKRKAAPEEPMEPARKAKSGKTHDTIPQASRTVDRGSQLDPSKLAAAEVKRKPSRNETSVVGVIDVKSGSGKATSKKAKAGENSGLDLKSMFSKPAEETGLGVGGW